MGRYRASSALPVRLTFAGASGPLVCATAGDQAAAAPTTRSMPVTGRRAPVIAVTAVCRSQVNAGAKQGLCDAARGKGREAVIGQLNSSRRGDAPGEIANAIVIKK